MDPIKRLVVGKNRLWFLREGPGAHGDTPLSAEAAQAALEGKFAFVAGTEDAPGLRSPQLGALHAILAHRSMESSDPITIVMPTGTGKTETMLAAHAHKPARTLVIVPSDALRSQIAKKFVTLGVLPVVGAVSGGFRCPVVAVVKSSLTSVAEVDDLVGRSNVVVATPQSLLGFTPAARTRLVELCDRLYIDEAHHVAASTWRSVAELFSKKELIQFTATPYREDGKHLNGRVAYAYPLRLAQQNGYFARINYHSIVDLADPDRAVAVAALAQLREDLAAGLDHVLMARVQTISRAQDVIKYYEELAPDLEPIRLDSKLSATAQREGLEKVVGRTSRAVVCVDMLGEGFDLPELKVAAIHDPHKSLAVTLQFVGRFTRVGGDTLGEASAFVPRQVSGIDDRLRQLYGQDADWNAVIEDLTERAVGREKERSDFEQGFGSRPEELAMRSIRPKMSTVIYRSANLEWNPSTVYDLFEDELLTTTIGINDHDKVVWFVTAEPLPVPWAEFAGFSEVIHHLYVVHCDTEKGFLYINSSNNDLLHEDLAKAIGGDDVEILRGDKVYRVLAGIDRRVPTNVGLLDVVSRTRRFSMHTGQDVIEGFGAEAGSKVKTNIFAHGYSAGRSVSIGASRKGRVWSHQVAEDIHDWVTWAKQIGPVVTNEAITLESVMSGFLIPVPATERPALVPLAIEWPYHLTGTLSESRSVSLNGQSYPLFEVELRLCSNEDAGPIRFELASPTWRAEYGIVFHEDKAPTFTAVGADARIT
ncbi:MAG TPA: hypothetical protein DCR14_04785, partial [Acidimicrobiaceae bacterium]|nr:hypothetical protein [Acidimicrobiaceae bacterium]